MSKWNETIQQMTAMTDTAPSVQPVRAWAVVDRENTISVDTSWSKRYAQTKAKSLDIHFANRAPHRVIRVEIREVADDE